MSVALWGHVLPPLAVAEELVSRGHRVTFATGAEMADSVRSAGACFLPYKSPFEGLDMYRAVNETDPESISTLLYDDCLAILRSVELHLGADPPDAVAYDVATALSGHIAASSWRRPAITLSPVFASRKNLSAMQSMLDSAAVDNPESRPLGFTEQLSTYGFGSLVPRLAEVLAARGITKPVDEFFSGAEEFNLVFLPRFFQYEGESFDERFAFVGPCLGTHARTGTWTPPGNGFPVVLMSVGTVFNRQSAYFRTFIEAFTDVPVHVVITLGAGVDPTEFQPLPPNVELHNWLPLRAVLPHAKVLVTHGGTGSVMQSLSAGCPVLAIPLSRDVQPTSRRIAELGLGRVVQPDDATPENLRRHVLEIISDRVTADRVRRVSPLMAEAGGAPRAADEMERYLSRTRGLPGTTG